MEGKYQNQIQLLKKLSKQKLVLLQHQRNMCEIIFSAMASAEKVALKMSSQKEYQSYDPFDSSSFKDEMQLENEFANKLVFLRSGLLAYKMEHGDFIFPDKNIKEEMIKDIQKWVPFLGNNRPKALESFKVLLDLLNGSTKEIPNNCFHNYEIKTDEKYVLNQAEHLMKFKKDINKQDIEVQNDYEKTGEHIIPFNKIRKNQNANDAKLYEFIEAEKNADTYLKNLIKKVNSKKAITKEEDTIMWNYISLLQKNLNDRFLEPNIIQSKLNYYQNGMNNASLNIDKNQAYELIYQYCQGLYTIYYNNSKMC